MSGSGSENRQRQITLKARFTEAEAALIETQAERAGVSVAALIRFALLDQEPLRASRRPTVERTQASQLLARLGTCAEALRQAAAAGNPAVNGALIDAATRDLAEMRNALFTAMGRAP